MKTAVKKTKILVYVTPEEKRVLKCFAILEQKALNTVVSNCISTGFKIRISRKKDSYKRLLEILSSTEDEGLDS